MSKGLKTPLDFTSPFSELPDLTDDFITPQFTEELAAREPALGYRKNALSPAKDALPPPVKKNQKEAKTLDENLIKRNFKEKSDSPLSCRVAEMAKRKLETIAFAYDISSGVFITNLVNDFWEKYGDLVQAECDKKTKSF